VSLLLLFGGEAVVEVTGTLAETLDDTTSAADGASGASGTLAETLADATSAAAGSSVTGTVAETLDDTTSAASGAAGGASGSLTETLDAVTSAAAGASGASGTVAETLDDATSAATGASGAAGTLAVTLADVFSAAEGTHAVPGSLNVTLDNVTSAAVGEHTQPVTGTVDETLADITSTATGTYTELVPGDPSPVKCTMRRQKFSRKFRYHRHAERPAIQVWALDARNDLINFSDASYSFILRIGHPGSANYVEKTSNITGAVGSGVMRNGTPNLTIAWEPGELDIDPGVYTCELIASSAFLDVVYHGTLQIVDRILP
jgi:hypothetical protein